MRAQFRSQVPALSKHAPTGGAVTKRASAARSAFQWLLVFRVIMPLRSATAAQPEGRAIESITPTALIAAICLPGTDMQQVGIGFNANVLFREMIDFDILGTLHPPLQQVLVQGDGEIDDDRECADVEKKQK